MSEEDDISKKKKLGVLLFVFGIGVIILGSLIISIISNSSCENDPHGYCGFGFFIRYLIILAFGVLLVAFGIGNGLSAKRAEKRLKKGVRTGSDSGTSVAKKIIKWLFTALLTVAIIAAIPMTCIYTSNGSIIVADILIVIGLAILIKDTWRAKKK